MRHFSALLIAGAALLHSTLAVNLFVSSYDGNVTSLSLTGSGSNYSFQATFRDTNCGTSPSWLVYDKPAGTLYCLDEDTASSTQSGLTSYKFNESGMLTLAQSRLNLSTPSAVNGAIFGSGDFKAMAIAHYTGQVSTVDLSGNKAFNEVQMMNYVNITQLGPDAAIQNTPHPHQAALDPTGQYIVTPDLGADLLRVYCWAAVTANNTLEEHPTFKMKAGSGPRHAAWWQGNSSANSTDNTYLFVVTQITNMITSYKVTYLPRGLNFTEVYSNNTFGGGQIPVNATAGEIQISPDKRFVSISNRNDQWFSHTDGNVTQYSDSLATYEVGQNGMLRFTQLWPAYGSNPRHFAFNAAGDLAAIALTDSSSVVVMPRNVSTGELGFPVAEFPVGTTGGLGPTNIVWDE